jgi:hypothetical protein
MLKQRLKYSCAISYFMMGHSGAEQERTSTFSYSMPTTTLTQAQQAAWRVTEISPEQLDRQTLTQAQSRIADSILINTNNCSSSPTVELNNRHNN